MYSHRDETVIQRTLLRKAVLKICLAQLEVDPSKDANLRRVVSVIEGLEPGTRLVVFPEYSMGYPKEGLTPGYALAASEGLDGDFVGQVAKLSGRKHLGVVLPIFERARNRVFNTAVVIADGRVLGGYRKSKLFDALGYKESDVFGTGSELVVFELSGLRFGIVICYDVRFPELAKREAMAGAQVILVPSAWYRGEMKEEQWQTLLMARAHEDTCYVVGVGNANPAFIGRSIVVTPFGIKALDLGTGERVSYFELNPKTVRDARKKLPVLRQSDNVSPPCRLLNGGR
jgi:predicted amidohydrolase